MKKFLKNPGVLGLVLIAVVLIGLAAFGKRKVSGPEEAVQRLITAFNDQDLEALVDCYDPDYAMIIERFGSYSWSYLAEEIEFPEGEIRFLPEGVRYPENEDGSEQTEEEASKATVTGILIVETAEDDVETAGCELKLVKKDDEWYLSV